jgi:acetolactate synthase-1/2/3 large subunit
MSHNAPCTLSTAEALVESLLRHGMDTVYGLPGVHNDLLFDAFHGAGERLKVVHTRHEQAAAYMALGAAMATGRPQAFSVVPGPGFLNASAALLTAYASNAPVLALLGQIPQADIDRGHGHLHELHDQIGIAGHMSKYAARITAPHEAPLRVRDALKAMMSGRRRPAALECAIDVWGRRGPVEFPDMPAELEEPPLDPDAVEAAAKLLGAAKNPLIVAGGGAMDAGGPLLAVAEMLQAPVLTYRRGRGAIPTTHPLHVNLPLGHRLWKEVDVVLAVGTRLMIQQANWGMDDDVKVIRLDIDPEEPNRMRRPAVALVGDAGRYLEALLDRLPAHAGKRAPADLGAHRGWMAERLAQFEPQMGYLKAIRSALPPHGVFVDDVTQMGFAARLNFEVTRPRTYLSPGYQDNLGWAYGAALGAASALEDTPVVCVAGDGGFMYQAGELATAVKHNLPVVVVVFDNGLFGNVHLIQRNDYGGRHISTELANPDFVKLADAFGMASFRATDPAGLEAVLKQAIALKGPALVHVPCGEWPSPWDMILMPKVRG